MIGKILVFWIGGRLWEVVAYERRSHMEMRLWISTFLYTNTTQERRMVLKFLCRKSLGGLMS